MNHDSVHEFIRGLDERMSYPEEDIEEWLQRRRRESRAGDSNSSASALSVAISAADPSPSSNDVTGTDLGHAKLTEAMPLAAVAVTQTSPRVKRKSPDTAAITSRADKKQKTGDAHQDLAIGQPPQSIKANAGSAAYLQDTLQRVITDREDVVHNPNNHRDSLVAVHERISVTGLQPSVSNARLDTIDNHDPGQQLDHFVPLMHMDGPIDAQRNTDDSRKSVEIHVAPASDEQPPPSTVGQIEKFSGEFSASLVNETPKGSNYANASHRDKVLQIPNEDVRPARGADSSTVTTPPSSAISLLAASSTPIRTTKTRLAENQKQKKTLKKEKSKKKPKELISPTEYAQRLQAKLSEGQLKKHPSVRQYLRGKKILYYGGDMRYASAETRGRMDFITKHGGTLLATYDPAQVTHIVTDAPKKPFLRNLGLKSLDQIPSHIPTVKWSWVISGLGRDGTIRTLPSKAEGKAVDACGGNPAGDKGNHREGENEAWMDYEFMHASFKERIDAGPSWTRIKPQKRGQEHADVPDIGSSSRHQMNRAQESGEVSSISEFTQDKFAPQCSVIDDHDDVLRSLPSSSLTTPESDARESSSKEVLRASKTTEAPSTTCKDATDMTASSSAHDPLATFYAEARAERDAELLHGQNTDIDSEDESDTIRQFNHHDTHREAAQKRGFICDIKGPPVPEDCPNQDIIDKLEELSTFHKAKLSEEDKWRVYSYGKAIRSLKNYPVRIRSYDEARAIRGIGDKTAQKIMEIIQTGGLRRIGYEETEDVGVVNLFQGIYGVGRNIAHQWYAAGCRTLEDVKDRKGGIKLSAVQAIGLKYYTDINTRMPRGEAAEIYSMIKPIALSIDPDLFIEITGSYRRGKADCGDIDILITRPTADGKTHHGVFQRLLQELHRQGIITEDLAVPEDFDDLELIYRGLCRRDSHSMRRRIDFLTVPYESRGAALLYYTGDDIFNRSMRLKANKMGYSLNQRGLLAGVVRNPSDRRQKINEGTIIASETEREIFDILGVPWQEPWERVRG